jgi:nondiscriminating aspartyl-tRNA synthetase
MFKYIVGQNTRLNNRILDLRVPANQAIMRVSAGICRFFREFLQDSEFVEIHSPKLIGGTSEGGAEVFRLDYFGNPACLAQSPQLYKQMGVVCDLERVFEIGPVFRAEKSMTPRHLCEFTGLDLEMAFYEHYFEVLDLICEMFGYIFEKLNEKYKKEIEVVREQYPFEDFVFKKDVPKIKFSEAVEILKEAGYEQNPLKDLETENEEVLGRIVKEKYGTDFFVVYNYPKDARPFYSMLDPTNEEYTNSYDFFMRGQEILSGAQRIHDPAMLKERAIEKGIPPETIEDYINCFQYGSYPHAGAGIGLERILKLFLGIHNIRKCSMFPRDPKRLTP